MSDMNLLYWGVSVFVLMVIGLGLTYFEFRYGAPSQQAAAVRRQKEEKPDGQQGAIQEVAGS